VPLTILPAVTFEFPRAPITTSKRDEDKTMRYDKPEVVKLANAIDAIQGNSSKGVAPAETTSILISTVGAYEADE
jgi:hypothetical protein